MGVEVNVNIVIAIAPRVPKLKPCEPAIVGWLRKYLVHHKPTCELIKRRI